MRRRWIAFVAVALGVVAAWPNHGATRGERSIRLPEIREAVPASRFVVRSMVWSRDADAPDETMLAVGGGAVALASRGHVCSFAETTGAMNWCGGIGHDPVYAGGVVAYTGEDGAIYGVDARTGRRRWRFAFPTSARGRALAGPRLRPEHRAWSTGASFLIARTDGRAGHGAPDDGEVSASGRLLWSAQENGAHGDVVLAPPFVLQQIAGSGARIVISENVIRLGRGIVSRIDDATSVIATQHGRLTAEVDSVEPIEEHFLALDVGTYDLASGKLLEKYRYEPDYDENDARYNAGIRHEMNSGEIAHGEGDAIYPFIGGNLYRYRLAPAHGQRPVLLATDRSYLGGPYRDTVYVRRADGVWALRADEHAVHARLVAASPAKPTMLAAADGDVYVGFADGTVRGVDGATGATILDARACPPTRITVTNQRVYVACRGTSHWRILAYARRTAL
jgi:hypothetical protein